jgi:hypothetical protein
MISNEERLRRSAQLAGAYHVEDLAADAIDHLAGKAVHLARDPEVPLPPQLLPSVVPSVGIAGDTARNSFDHLAPIDGIGEVHALIHAAGAFVAEAAALHPDPAWNRSLMVAAGLFRRAESYCEEVPAS